MSCTSNTSIGLSRPSLQAPRAGGNCFWSARPCSLERAGAMRGPDSGDAIAAGSTRRALRSGDHGTPNSARNAGGYGGRPPRGCGTRRFETPPTPASASSGSATPWGTAKIRRHCIVSTVNVETRGIFGLPRGAQEPSLDGSARGIGGPLGGNWPGRRFDQGPADALMEQHELVLEACRHRKIDFSLIRSGHAGSPVAGSIVPSSTPRL